MSFFRPVVHEQDGQTYVITVEEMEGLVNAGDYWHREGDPSTWLTVAVFRRISGKFPNASQDLRLDLTARSLGITVDKVLHNIEFNEAYMRMHDGDDSYRVLD